ncbi:hypothetical protein RF11_14029 [Thelohanellus kitauei]|uniref:EF-hand domain-containing protein n=1 Tax=Thelohanellus kitauei TaxID=669202 RepID=A0A0C2MHN8_THEKT|nr:hypothetical protein RF11_14029 [Thelohanellus kitauei]
MVTQSLSPPIFTIDNFLSESECEELRLIGVMNPKVLAKTNIPFNRLDMDNDGKITIQEIHTQANKYLRSKMSLKDVYRIDGKFNVFYDKERVQELADFFNLQQDEKIHKIRQKST